MWLKKIYQKVSYWLNYYYSFTSVNQMPTKVVVQPGYWLDFNLQEKEFLISCAASFGYTVDYSRGYRQKETAIIPLKEVTFLGNSGALVKHNQVIKESVFDQMRLTKSPAFRSPAWMVPQKKVGRYTSLMHLPWGQSSNYHWFLDCLPRLYALLQTQQEPITLIIPAELPAFQRETLNFLIRDYSFISLESITKTQKWHLPQFILSTFISNHYSGYLPPEVLRFMRAGIWQGYGVKDEPFKTRIYISRAKANKRRLLQEEALLKVLQNFNFKIVFAEGLTYAQQVQLFYNAEMVLGVHGAGLTNILFGRDLQVIELHPADVVRSHYFMICKALGFNYNFLLGSAVNDKQDFSIDPNALALLLKKLLGN